MSSSPILPEELVDSVVEVTGTNAAEARHLLSACDNNVEAAIALYFEQGGGDVTNDGANDINGDVAESGDSMPNICDQFEDDVRAPIAPIREQLIGPEDDNFLSSSGSGDSNVVRSTRIAQQRLKVKVCPLRDFAREGALMEQQLQAAIDGNAAAFPLALSGTENGNSNELSSTNILTNRRRQARAAAILSTVTDPRNVHGKSAASSSSSSRLCDLFRPPTDIAFAGTFQTARLRATDIKHWLLVNVQSDNFDSQLLNRDVWSDKDMRRLIMRQFLLWQVDADSSEGRRFVAFYHCATLPYVCIIDPRTGEEVWHSAAPNQANLMPDLKRFLRERNDFSKELADDMPSTSSKRASTTDDSITIDDDDNEQTSCSADKSSGGNGDGHLKKRAKLLELSEEEQIALAIRNSMKENGNGASGKRSRNIENDDDNAENSGSDFDSVDEFGVDEEKDDNGTVRDTTAKTSTTSYEMDLGNAKDELTALKLRLLNTDGADEVIELRWPSDTHLAVLHRYIAQLHKHIPEHGYKLICAFPRKTLEATDNGSSLKELGLHPSANLHLTLDD